MSGLVMLAGGGEFDKGLEAADREALLQSGTGITSPTPALSLVVAVASSPRKTGDLLNDGTLWLGKLGAFRCEGLAINDRLAANTAETASKIVDARLIYLVGGDPTYLIAALENTVTLTAMRRAVANGAVLAASGSGAMSLAQYAYIEEEDRLVNGLGFVPDSCVIPYHSSKGRKWSKRLTELLPQAYLLGLDEKCAMIGYGNDWRVFGRGWITVYKGGKPRKFVNGQPFALNPKAR
jgi:cyanophycinase-like exopeptidase